MTVPLVLVKELGEVFDDRGKVLDSASSELKRIRRSIHQTEIKARKTIESVLGGARNSGYTDQEGSLTIRDGRLVIPILAEFKRKIKGVVVDESATGKTVYLEPLEVFNLNNDIRELYFVEKREINRILRELTQKVGFELPAIDSCQQFLGALDFTRAKAKLAVKLKAIKPNLQQDIIIDLQGAQHPLLLIAHQEAGLGVVPLDVQLDQQHRVLVISGPNAGGKSVCLKTIGLLQLMAQSGLLVPVKEQSRLGIFQKILVDIGDEQSIENDLSTYSGHLVSMKNFVQESDRDTLFLIDEFGSGTEPQFGGPIAEAILEQLVTSKAFGVITTHYSNLKEFADQNPGVINAAMRFDLDHLEPLYQLEMGRPGSSFALEIAAKTGLPPTIIEAAKSKIGHDPIAFEQMVSALESTKFEHDQKLKELEELRAQAKEAQQKYQELITQVRADKRAILNKSKLEAQQLLKEANKRIESTIRTIKEHKADKANTQAARQKLQQFSKRTEVSKKKSKPQNSQGSYLKGEIEVGDIVELIESGAQGEVLQTGKDWAEVSLGQLKSKIKLKRLRRISAKPAVKPSSGKTSSNVSIIEKRSTFKDELDVRGERAEAALNRLMQFIDEGLMLGFGELRVIHGRGDGILREVVRNYLYEDPSVRKFSDEHPDRGGDGATVIFLK